MGNFFSNLLAPKASHKEFVKFVADSQALMQQAEALKKDGGTNNRTHVFKHGGKSHLSKVNQPTTPSRRDHVEMFKRYEGFLKTEKAKRLYGEPFVEQALNGLRNIRKGNKRFEVELLHCVDGFVDPAAYKTMWRERSETATLFCHNMDAVNALAEQGFTQPKKGVRLAFAQDAKRNVETAHQQAVDSAKLFQRTCLPVANAESVSPTQTELANWLNKAFAAHSELKEFRASSFVDALFGSYPNKITELNRELDDLYAQLHAGHHDSALLTQISNVGQQLAACIENYLRKLALVGQLLADKFPWKEAPFGSIGIAVASGHDLNRLAQAYLANGSPMMEMHCFATKAQAQVFGILHDGKPAPHPTWQEAVEKTSDAARHHLDRVMRQLKSAVSASARTPEQERLIAWWKDAFEEYPHISFLQGTGLDTALNFRWNDLSELEGELKGLMALRRNGVSDEKIDRDIERVSSQLIASIDRHLKVIDNLRRLLLAGADDKALTPAQRKLLASASQVVQRLLQRLTVPDGPLMALRRYALDKETETPASTPLPTTSRRPTSNDSSSNLGVSFAPGGQEATQQMPRQSLVRPRHDREGSDTGFMTAMQEATTVEQLDELLAGWSSKDVSESDVLPSAEAADPTQLTDKEFKNLLDIDSLDVSEKAQRKLTSVRNKEIESSFQAVSDLVDELFGDMADVAALNAPAPPTSDKSSPD
ncbi:MAG TPA: hypothetical protein VLG41_20205 [Hydrogenophaga sp.]|uniref:hypothetical protein n=1 Tax=Hydrogenophaga sp. TaxID=1904254 RepID=UPI002C667AA9|nr:hypothetical protein [Hydrogenophaga sp.]HSX95259.1 hypothetical protein [Hydrogenophaga sp.]